MEAGPNRFQLLPFDPVTECQIYSSFLCGNTTPQMPLDPPLPFLYGCAMLDNVSQVQLPVAVAVLDGRGGVA
jgi:hypothetical protein